MNAGITDNHFQHKCAYGQRSGIAFFQKIDIISIIQLGLLRE